MQHITFEYALQQLSFLVEILLSYDLEVPAFVVPWCKSIHVISIIY